MNPALQKVGELFRTKREEMHLSLREVENATSIRMMFLQAIEEGKAEKFLSPVYLIGFIKQYAVFLGFDGEQVIKDYPDAFRLKNQKQEFSYGIGTLEHRGSGSTSLRSLPNMMWIGVSVLALIAAWYLMKATGVFA